jgi:hypothetical protein
MYQPLKIVRGSRHAQDRVSATHVS